MAQVVGPQTKPQPQTIQAPAQCPEKLPLLPVAATLTFTFLLLCTLIYANEFLGRCLNYSIHLYSPAVFVFQTPVLNLKYYGLFLLLGIFADLIAGLKAGRLWQFDSEAVLTFFTLAIVGGSLGARLYYTAICWPYYIHHPEEILNASLGGLSIHGCLLGMGLFLFVYSRFTKRSVVKYLDFASIFLPLGQAIWRLGNLFNSEAFGGPLSGSALLQQLVAPPFRPKQFAACGAFHPAFLYEAIWDLALFSCLYFGLAKPLARKPGMLACLYLAGYSLGRILIESIRTDSIMYGAISVPMTVSVSCLVAGCLGVVLLKNSKSQEQRAEI